MQSYYIFSVLQKEETILMSATCSHGKNIYFCTVKTKNLNIMSGAISLQQSMMREIISLFGDEEAMRKVITSVRKIKRERVATEELTPKEKAEVLSGIREGLKEVKLAKQGKLELQEWEGFKHELRH